jgi:prepilin-type N-terminal cleavage/methylation domain-containing protein
MKNKQKTYRAFTLIEIVVAVALLALVFAFAGAIFKVSINSYHTAVANAEIIQKLRAITDQLNADFAGLRKDGEIFVIWKASLKNGFPPADPNSYERFDRIMFFADGEFQSYGRPGQPDVNGNLARICYILASKPPVNIGVDPPERPSAQKPEKRVLAKTQHILTSTTGSQTPTDANIDPQDWYRWNNLREYECDDVNTLDKWKNAHWSNPGLSKKDMLSVIADVNVDYSTIYPNIRGAMVDTADPNTIHNLLCEGVGEFKIQGWYDAGNRWVPEIDPNGDGSLADSDFLLSGGVIDPIDVPGVLYPYPPYGGVILGGVFYSNNFQGVLNEANFNSIPGLGRALKFTFTLYDSKGVFKQGRTFTHIVYIGN